MPTRPFASPHPTHTHPTLPLLFLSIALTGALFARAASALPPPAPAAPACPSYTTTVTFVNRTPLRRREWGLATVPFPAGVWSSGKSFRAGAGAFSELTPFGGCWPDGSVRFAQLAIALDLAPQSEQVVTIEEGVPNFPPFNLSNWTTIGLANFSLQLEVGVPGIGPRIGQITGSQLVLDLFARKTVFVTGRIPDTDLRFDLWATFFTDQDNATFELRLINSDATSVKWKQDVDWVDLLATGNLPLVRGATRRGVSYLQSSLAGPNRLRLLGPTFFYDGQGQEWSGDLVFAFPATMQGEDLVRLGSLVACMHEPLYGCASNWRSSGAYGPFGCFADDPAWVTDGGRAATLAQRAAYLAWSTVPGGAWDDLPLGLLPHASNTGDQPDFGTGKLLDVFASGLPDGIEEARLNAAEECCRPVHHREGDGSPLLASNHPQWTAWNGRTHFNTTVSSDRLGKPWPEPWIDAHYWTGRDNQHWSSLTLANAYLLTGSFALRAELDNEVELYLASQTLPSQKPGWSTNIIDTPRAVGRTFLSMSWNWLCTGRQDLKDRMAARVRECIAPQWAGGWVSGFVKPVMLAPPDARTLVIDHWTPWEDSLAIVGLEAAYRLTGEPAARYVAYSAAKTLVSWGWKITPSETIVATAIGWKQDGQPLNPAEYADPHWVLWSYGTGFNLWALPSTKLAREYALATNDMDMLARANAILTSLNAARMQPPGRGFDRYMEWDCAR